MNVLYHYSYSFADAFSQEIASRVHGSPLGGYNLRRAPEPSNTVEGPLPKIPAKKPPARDERSPGLLCLGSIFHFARAGDSVWGTGINPRWQRPVPPERLDIRAVRGPLTREYMRDRLGLPCPEIYGDPGILFRELFPEYVREDRGQPLVLAQHNDEEVLAERLESYKGFPLFLGQREGKPWQEFVERICKASYVISSSLHGLILAESFGVPARWWHDESLPSARTEGRFKFNDYYLSTRREPNQYAKSLEEAMAIGPMPGADLQALRERLRKAFPSDLFTAAP